MTPTEFTPWTALLGGALIGIAAVMLLAILGRAAGISGIVSRLLPPYENTDPIYWRVAFVVGLIAAPLLFIAVTGQTVRNDVSPNLALLAGAGLLVGFGTVYGSGCTSGHGVCGTARFSQRSIVATLVFMVVAIATVFVMRHVLGG